MDWLRNNWLRDGLPREAQGGLVVLLGLPLLPLLLMVAYNLTAPLFHASSMTYAEAVGVTLLVGLLAGLVALLKE